MSQDNRQNQNSLLQTIRLTQAQITYAPGREFVSLNLTSDRLAKRIQSLKDYDTYKRTKIQRIESNDSEMTKSPILNLVTQLGKKQNQNPVLSEYLNGQIQQPKPEQETNVQTKLEEQLKERKRKSQSPRFISFKVEQRPQLVKVAKMLKHRSQQMYQPLRSYTKSEHKAKTTPISETIVVTPFPKELTKLKRRLKLRPMLHHFHRRFTTDYSQRYDEEGESSEKINHSGKGLIQLRPVVTDNITKEIPMFGRLSEMEQDKTETCVPERPMFGQTNKNQFNGLAKGRKSSVSSKVDPDATFKRRIRSRVDEIMRRHSEVNQKYVGRWPSYSQFSRSEQDQAQIVEIMSNFKRETDKNVDIAEPLYRLQQKIEKQLQWQQREMDWAAVGQKSPLGSKFSHYLQLQKRAYKKNLQDLKKYKMQYQVEGQRQLVWANGIKRLKKY